MRTKWLAATAAVLAVLAVSLAGSAAGRSSPTRGPDIHGTRCPAFTDHEGGQVVQQERIQTSRLSCSAAHWFIAHIDELTEARYILAGLPYRVRGGWRCTYLGARVHAGSVSSRTRCVGKGRRQIEWVRVQPRPAPHGVRLRWTPVAAMLRSSG